MSFNRIPEKDFLNRGPELDYLRTIAGLRGKSLAGNVLLRGARGIGKSELLKQLHNRLFWEEDIVPFYYSFRTANLRGTNFSRDYFARFLRQYLGFIKKDPSLLAYAGEPLHSLYAQLSSAGMGWLPDLADHFLDHVTSRDLYAQIMAAISVPVAAAQKGGRPVLLMLDDFDVRILFIVFQDRRCVVTGTVIDQDQLPSPFTAKRDQFSKQNG